MLLGTTSFLKSLWGRERPIPPAADDKSARATDMRSKETNCSMPSGDAAQSALFAFTAMNCFPHAALFLGGPLGSAQFVMTVSFARVYFHCHWLGDVMIGIFVGCIVGLFTFKFGLRKGLKSLYLNTIGLPTPVDFEENDEF